jgi:hypothetical protein
LQPITAGPGQIGANRSRSSPRCYRSVSAARAPSFREDDRAVMRTTQPFPAPVIESRGGGGVDVQAVQLRGQRVGLVRHELASHGLEERGARSPRRTSRRSRCGHRDERELSCVPGRALRAFELDRADVVGSGSSGLFRTRRCASEISEVSSRFRTR